MSNVKLTKKQKALITDSLRSYFDITSKILEDDGVYLTETKIRPLGHIEKSLLKQRKQDLKPLITKFENL